MSEFPVSDEQRNHLLEAACEVRSQAYAPYSKYKVGAAILGQDGRVYTGANVENAVYNLGTCAERSAVFAAASQGLRQIIAVAVCTENMGAPCGGCRQVLSEFAYDFPIWLTDGKGNVRETTLVALLPDQFGPEDLPA